MTRDLIRELAVKIRQNPNLNPTQILRDHKIPEDFIEHYLPIILDLTRSL